LTGGLDVRRRAHPIKTGRGLHNCTSAGSFATDDLNALLMLLRDNLAIASARRGDEIVLSSTATF
jgi:hypothetical protein